MRIDPIRPASMTPTSTPARGEALGFTQLMGQPPTPAAHSSPPSLLAGTIPLPLDDEDPRRRNRRQARHGRDLLDSLDAVRRELLAGRFPIDRLRELAAAINSAVRPSDPALASIIDEIAVRVAVELAKRTNA